ncbi:ABC transporter permease [Mixta tenebrionis]|uniref:Protein mcbE n=1 Tax=Mixta tenebrionis TaxID=2562439 RepID=A0A506VBJ5_9GAMM|nr:ABC transporter permease [Mixta tenebrionis]TPW42799.1 protein mcbE [Mixta tenebrionis]
MKIAKMTGIFLKEQLRTPLGVIWSVISPAVLFFFMHFDDIDRKSGDKQWLLQQVGWFIGYISLSVILFSYCLYLIGRRESGFVATFIYNRASKFIFILSQMLASLVMLFIYLTFFMAIVFIGFQVTPGEEFLRLLLSGMVLSILIMPAFTWLAGLPVTFPTANIIFSVLLMMFMLFGMIALKKEMAVISLTNSVNPLLIYSAWLSEGKSPLFSTGALLFYCLMLLSSLLTVYRFRTEPVWSTQ